jgi:hypothetical protein
VILIEFTIRIADKHGQTLFGSALGRRFRQNAVLWSGATAPPKLVYFFVAKKVELHGISFRGIANEMADDHSAGLKSANSLSKPPITPT